MNKILSLILSLLLVLTPLPCGVAFADVEEPAFEPSLVGAWRYIGMEERGKEYSRPVMLMTEITFFLPDGTVSADSFETCAYYSLDQLRIEAANGETNLGELLPDYALSICKALLEIPESGIDEEDFADLEDTFSKISDLNVTYTFEDFDYSSTYVSESDKPRYDADPKDALILHVTGSYHENVLSTEAIDSTLVFAKSSSGFVYSWVNAVFCGEWTDASNNSWEFHYAPNENGYLSLTGSMTDSSGKLYQADEEFDGFILYNHKGIGSFSQDSTVKFMFSDFRSPEYKIASYDAHHISLISDQGNLDLTRK